MGLSDLEQEIIAEGKRVYAAARAEALKLRKSKLVAEIRQIEEDLATLFGHSTTSEPVTPPDPAPAPEVDPEPDPAPEEAPVAPEDGKEPAPAKDTKSKR